MIRVLVVDDEPLTASAHAEYVARCAGFEVAGIARNGAAAVRAVRERAASSTPVDLVLLDLTLPDISGLEVARALHFPTMLYFALFIVVHVILVFSTGALRNLNHMYAAQGSTDPAAYADNWAGLLFFALSLLVIAGAWIACRPIVLSMIAGVFGKVSSR